MNDFQKEPEMKRFVYLIGPPGSGKTTAIRSVCTRGMKVFTARKPITHVGYVRSKLRFCVLGEDREPFGGTDTLSWTAVSNCKEWLAALPDVVFAEGDRLAIKRFFDEVRLQYELSIVYLNCPDPLLEARRAVRAKQFGLELQGGDWVRGRVTKHRRIAESEGAMFVDASAPPEDIADYLWTLATNGGG